MGLNRLIYTSKKLQEEVRAMHTLARRLLLASLTVLLPLVDAFTGPSLRIWSGMCSALSTAPIHREIVRKNFLTGESVSTKSSLSPSM